MQWKEANSISDIILTELDIKNLTISFVSEIPGLFTIKSGFRVLAFWCEFSSKSIPSGIIEKSPNDMNSFDKYEKIEIAKAGHLSLKMNENIDIDLTWNYNSLYGVFSYKIQPRQKELRI